MIFETSSNVTDDQRVVLRHLWDLGINLYKICNPKDEYIGYSDYCRPAILNAEKVAVISRKDNGIIYAVPINCLGDFKEFRRLAVLDAARRHRSIAPGVNLDGIIKRGRIDV